MPLEGWLQKQGPQKALQVVNRWKKRWFVERDGSVFYYATPEDKAADKAELGSISLRTAFHVRPNKYSKEGHWAFEICLPGRVYSLLANSKSEMEHWIIGLQSAITGIKPSGETSSSSSSSPPSLGAGIPPVSPSSIPPSPSLAATPSSGPGRSLANSGDPYDDARANTRGANDRRSIPSPSHPRNAGGERGGRGRGRGRGGRGGFATIAKMGGGARGGRGGHVVSPGRSLPASPGDVTLNSNGVAAAPHDPRNPSPGGGSTSGGALPPPTPSRRGRPISGRGRPLVTHAHASAPSGMTAGDAGSNHSNTPTPPRRPRGGAGAGGGGGGRGAAPSSPHTNIPIRPGYRPRPQAPLSARPSSRGSDDTAGPNPNYGTSPDDMPHTRSRRRSSLPDIKDLHLVVNGCGEPDDEQRFRIVQELFHTERDYVKYLNILKTHYMIPLCELADTEKSIKKEDMKFIFGNIEMIIPLNQDLMKNIEARVHTWSATSTLGDLFVQIAPFLKMYNDYGNNYEKAIAVVTKYQKNPTFCATVESCDASTDVVVRLESLLVMPIQRVPRYNLLLADILKKTDPSHRDYNDLLCALKSCQQIGDFLDSGIAVSENQRKFMEISSKGAKKLLAPHRKLVAETTCSLKGGSKLSLWLFNDILIHIDANQAKDKKNLTKKKHHWPLGLVWVDRSDEGGSGAKSSFSSLSSAAFGRGDDSGPGFTVLGPKKTYHIRFPSDIEKDGFYTTLCGAIRQLELDATDPKRTGAYTFPEGDVLCGGTYDGEWVMGQMQGEGCFQFLNNIYEGQWDNCCRSGQGQMRYASGDVYAGMWSNNLQHGFGVLSTPAGDNYDGSWEAGRRCGRGEMKFSNGDLYTGNWSDNQPHGDGNLQFDCGVHYRGSFHQGKFTGKGCLVFPNGKKYDGEWNGGLKEGSGTLVYGNGDVYVGMFKADRRHGYGVLSSGVEGTYEGEWKDGLKDGKGVMSYGNHDHYDGLWRRGLFHGTGTLTMAGGSYQKYTGQFRDHQPHGTGVLTFRTGTVYEGSLKEGKPHGAGKWTHPNDSMIEGKWNRGMLDGSAKYSDGQKKGSRFQGTRKVGGLVGDAKVEFSLAPDLPVLYVDYNCLSFEETSRVIT